MDELRIIAPATHRNFPRGAMHAARLPGELEIFYSEPSAFPQKIRIFFHH
jgi:hypothetical protein